MNLKKILTITALIATSYTTVVKADDIRLGHPAMGGTGCPSGTAQSTLSPDQKSLSILFDEFMVEAGGGAPRTTDRKSCNIVIPVHIPQGLSISIIKADYRGFVDVPNVGGAMAMFTAEYFFAGVRGPRIRRMFRRGYTDDYIISNRLQANAIVWSRCGADVNLRVNAGIMIKNRSNVDAMATVDSADFTSGIIYRLQWRRC